MHPGQDARLAAWAGGRQGSLHIFANCRQSVKRIWNEDDGTSLQRKSEQPRPEPKCFKWITPVCHCDYTLLAGTATRWIVFYGFTADLFSFFSPPTWMHFSLYYVAWSEYGIVFAFELPHKQFICYFSLRGYFLFISEWSGWLGNHVYVYILMLCKWYFQLILACFFTAETVELTVILHHSISKHMLGSKPQRASENDTYIHTHTETVSLYLYILLVQSFTPCLIIMS